MTKVLTEFLLALADDKLLLGHRNSDWTGLGPILEEDIAFSSLAQDEIAHASAIYEFISGIDGRSADELAFGRSANDFRSAAVVESPDEFDWATAICRQFFCDHFDLLRLSRLARSSDKKLAALADRLRAEEQVHVDHVDGWIRRLGRGSEDSTQRMQLALDALAPTAAMLPETVNGQDELETSGVYPALESGEEMFDAWASSLRTVTDAAGLNLNISRPDASERGGRHGVHSGHLVPLLDEMCEVYRVEPGAAW